MVKTINRINMRRHICLHSVCLLGYGCIIKMTTFENLYFRVWGIEFKRESNDSNAIGGKNNESLALLSD